MDRDLWLGGLSSSELPAVDRARDRSSSGPRAMEAGTLIAVTVMAIPIQSSPFQSPVQHKEGKFGINFQFQEVLLNL